MKKVELSEILGRDITIERYQCLNPKFEIMYNDYLNKNIKLLYHKKDLMQFLNEQRDILLDDTPYSKRYRNADKKEKIAFLKQCVIRGLFPLAVILGLIASDDYKIHLKSKIYNSYGIVRNLGNDSNDDSMLEVNTEILNYVNNLHMPTEDSFYKNSNIFYNLTDNKNISDNISFIIALDYLGIDIIEIDGVKYSKTGYISEIHYKNNNTKGVLCTSKTFKNKELMELYVQEELKKEGLDSNIVVYEYSRINAKLFEDIPTIYKSMETGKIMFKEPNAVSTKVLKKIIKLD